MTIEDAVGILNVGVTHEEYPGRAEEVELVEPDPAILPSGGSRGGTARLR